MGWVWDATPGGLEGPFEKVTVWTWGKAGELDRLLAARPWSLTSREVRPESTLPDFQSPLIHTKCVCAQETQLKITHTPDRWANSLVTRDWSVFSFHKGTQPFVTSQIYMKLEWNYKQHFKINVSHFWEFVLWDLAWVMVQRAPIPWVYLL